MICLVGVFCGIDEQNCILRVLLGFLVWVPEKLFLGVLKKIKFFLQITHNGEHIKNSKKKSKNLIFDEAEKLGLKKNPIDYDW